MNNHKCMRSISSRIKKGSPEFQVSIDIFSAPKIDSLASVPRKPVQYHGYSTQLCHIIQNFWNLLKHLSTYTYNFESFEHGFVIIKNVGLRFRVRQFEENRFIAFPEPVSSPHVSPLVLSKGSSTL